MAAASSKVLQYFRGLFYLANLKVPPDDSWSAGSKLQDPNDSADIARPNGSSSAVSVTLFVVGFSLATAANNRVSKEKLAEAAMVAVNDCRDKEGATDADINMLKQHRLPATKEGLCMMECLFNTAGIMKDGKLDKAGAIEFCTPAMKGDVAKIKKMEEMMDLCEKEAGEAADACEAAKVVAVCTARRGKEFGFVMNNPIKS